MYSVDSLLYDNNINDIGVIQINYNVYFRYRETKNFYITKKICEQAKELILLENEFDDDEGANDKAVFEENQVELLDLLLNRCIGNIGIKEGIMGFDIYGIELYHIYGWSDFDESKRPKILNLEEKALKYFKKDYLENKDNYTAKYKNFGEYLLEKAPMPPLHSGNNTIYIGKSVAINREPNVKVLCKNIISEIQKKESLKNEAGVSEYLKIKYMNRIEHEYQEVKQAIDNWRLVNVYNNINPFCDSNRKEDYYATKGLRKEHNDMLAQKRTQIYSELVKNDEVPTRWGSETRLFKLVSKVYKDAVFQYHSEFLGMQSYDIYIPTVKIAIEYQGKQHYESIKFFGGEEAYKNGVKRDKKKRKISEENGIILIEWKYDEPISNLRLKEKLKEHNIML